MRAIRVSSILLICLIFVSWKRPDATHGRQICNRELLNGLYTYIEAPRSYTYRMADKVMDKYGEIGLLLEYRIEWQDTKSCDHNLIVTKVTATKDCPAAAANLYHTGDKIHITILEVTDKYLKYNSAFKGTSHQIIMYRINEKDLLEE